MKFWDSSAVVPLLIGEEQTAAMQAILAEDPQMLAWWATEIECVSAIARLERDGDLTGAAVSTALGRLDALVGGWHEIQPVAPARRIARRLLRTHTLRAADALQLAAAVVAGEGNAASLELVTLDGRLAEAARREGFAVRGPAGGD